MRDAFILIILALVAAAVGGFVYFAGQASTPPSAPAQTTFAPGTSIPVVTLAAGANSSVTTRTNYIITSYTQLQQLWKMLDGSTPMPSVDFSTQSVIAVFAGTEPTAGYTITVAGITDTPTTRQVAVTITQPGGSCVVGQVTTAPYQIIVVPNSGLSLIHRDTIATASCVN